MTRASKTDRIVSRVFQLLGLGLAIGGTYVAIKELPSLWRYANMKRIAKRTGATPALLPSFESPSYAQAPRRSGEFDRHAGNERRAGV